MARGVIRAFSLIAGEMYTARDENGTLVGFTIWIPPGRDGFDRCAILLFLAGGERGDLVRTGSVCSPDQFEMGFGDFLGRLDEEGRAFQEEAVSLRRVRSTCNSLNGRCRLERRCRSS